MPWRHPNFLVIGSSRSGSTSLRHHLDAHPEAYLAPRVEPRFFAFEGDALDYRGPGDRLLRGRVVTDAAGYRALFEGVRRERAVGEVSPAYLSSVAAPARISRYAPDAKLVAILRNPVERAISSFRFERLEGFETVPSLGAALDLEETRVRAHWSYVWRYAYRGLYYTHLCRYLALFAAHQIKVLLYEDWEPEGGRELLREVFRFLDLDESYLPVRAMHLNCSVPGSLAAVGIAGHEVSPECRARLVRLYAEEIDRLEELIGRDLSVWRRQHKAGSVAIE
jgi:Sulfotransferase family